MHPELFTLPVFGITIRTYGFCLTVGFLSAVWLAMRRAQRVKADPDRVLDLSFLALVFGVAGARLFYVVHYWKTDFAPATNKVLAVINIRQGGLEFLGGVLGAIIAIFIYLALKRQSVRLYLDVLAPGVMWGLAFGRIGCFFNGCCFGGLCVAGDGHQAMYPWAVRFPFGSPAQVSHWEERLVTVPAELVNTRTVQSYLLGPSTLSLSVERREGPKRRVERFQEALAEARKSAPDAPRTRQLQDELKAAKAALKKAYEKHRLADLDWAEKFPARVNPARHTSVSELEDLAAASRSLPVHPAQLYSSINAILLSALLSAVFYLRKRHGVVIGLMFVLYPMGRVIIEMIRADNPHDVAGLTISQFVSLALFILGIVYLFVIYRFLPERSPRAANAAPGK